jgi:glycosyltransferase involved in cell wall biosynthesis
VLRRARILLANSERTRHDLIRDLNLAPDRVHTVYLGSDSDWKTVTPERRAAARAWLNKPHGRLLVAFVGAFGHDSRKGFDTLWTAWQRLCARSDWDADLVVAGGGRALEGWRSVVERAGLSGRVSILGFTDRVTEVLMAADLLVSPVRYEPYGLNVQEAICCGVPAIVTASAGVAERYSAELGDFLLPDPDDAIDLARRMLRWRSDMEGAKGRIEPIARMLRGHTWDDMAQQIVALVQGAGAPANLLRHGA